MLTHTVEVGMTYRIQKHVELEDTSLHYGSGKVDTLLATPRLIALAIEASSRLIDDLLPEGYVSVAKHIEVDHFKATCLGSTVTVEVTIEEVEPDRIFLTFNAYDEHGKIGKGKMRRRLVNKDKLLEMASQRDQAMTEDK